MNWPVLYWVFEFSRLLTTFICSWINVIAHIISRLLIQYCIYSSYFSGSHSRSSLQQNPFHNCCCARVNFQSHHSRNKTFMKLHSKFFQHWKIGWTFRNRLTKEDIWQSNQLLKLKNQRILAFRWWKFWLLTGCLLSSVNSLNAFSFCMRNFGPILFWLWKTICEQPFLRKKSRRWIIKIQMWIHKRLGSIYFAALPLASSALHSHAFALNLFNYWQSCNTSTVYRLWQ